MRLASSAHLGQKRRGGDNYIIHPLRVANRVTSYGYKYECVGLLHDIIEDTQVDKEYLLSQGVDSDIVDAVVILTKTEDMSYEDYLDRVKNNEYARQVKIADMIDNLSDNPTIKQIKKYARGLVTLTEDM